MTRLFPFVALFALAMLGTSLILGLSLGDLSILRESAAANARGEPIDEATLATISSLLKWKSIHFLFGLLSALVVVFANSLVVTYFVGTSRWCREVAETYHLDPSFVARSNRAKRSSFPIATASMLIIVGISALGGAADPGAAIQVPPPLGQWHHVHLLAAMLGTLLIGAGFYKVWLNIAANGQVIEDVMAEVKRIRAERGLPVEVDA